MRCFLLLLVTISTFSTLTGAQQSWTTVKEWDSGPSNNRLDIVVLGDGYTPIPVQTIERSILRVCI